LKATEPASDSLQAAGAGVGPLLQRDYWAVIDGCSLAPAEVMSLVTRRFVELAPPETVVFHREGGVAKALDVGDELRVDIHLAGGYRVRVVHKDAQSFTLATLVGHPEAGRITFGAYRNAAGDVIFHIRSRARARSAAIHAGYVTAGEPMQTMTWTDFVNAVALTCGRGVIGYVQAETKRLRREDLGPDDARMDSPTFIAKDA
jgi:hypothetical protein